MMRFTPKAKIYLLGNTVGFSAVGDSFQAIYKIFNSACCTALS